MAKKSIIAREKKREKMVAQYAEQREKLKAAGDWEGLDKLPRNSSKVRLHNRCQLTGRPHGVYRKFGLSRIKLRENTLRGNVPGLVKASW